jgi:glycosyltransferase involved in cell wall biosynthesis
VKILFLDSAPSIHHDRFKNLLSIFGQVESIYTLEKKTILLDRGYELIVYADLDITFPHIAEFIAEHNAPIVGISWAWDLQRTKRDSESVKRVLINSLLSSDLIIVDCENSIYEITKLGVTPKRLFKSPYGLDLTLYPFRKRIIEPEKTLKLYSNRQWEKIYRPDLILDTALELEKRGTNFRLVMANDGSLRKNLLQKYRSIFDSERCSWIGKISNQDNLLELQKSNLFLSMAQNDGSSLSLLEAMAVGVTTLVTDNEANREWIIENSTGYLVNSNSPKLIADKIELISSELSSNFELLRSARKRIEESADWNEISNRIIEEIKQLFKT